MKRGSKLLCGLLSVAFLVTGCATVGNVNNTENEVIYNGNAAVCVSDYVYFGNSLADYSTFTNDNSYKDSAKISYLNRLENAVKLSANSKDYSPKNTEKVNDEVVGQDHNFMFVLGDYIYFTAPKREQERDSSGVPQYVYSHSTLYRSKLNGDGKSQIYKTNGDITNIQVLKYDGNYYIVMLAGTELVKIQIGNRISASVLASGVNAIAIPKTYQKANEQSTLDWNGYIFYTTTRKDENNSDITGTKLSKILVSGGNAQKVWEAQNKTLSLVGRERNVIYYTIGDLSYAFDTNTHGSVDLASNEYKIYDAKISDVNLIATTNKEYGLLFTSNSKTIYRTANGKTGVMTFTAEGSAITASVVQVSGRRIFLASTTGVYSAEISNVFNTTVDKDFSIECQTIATMSEIKTNMISYDGKYIYFYSKLQEVNEDAITETDSNYYLYRANISKTNDYALLSLTQTSSRHS